MVTMSEVWDRTVLVARHRAPELAAIALPLIWLPGLVQRGVQLALAGPTPGAPVAAGAMAAVTLIGAVTTLLALLAALAIVALASDRTLAPVAALRIGLRRLPLTVGLSLLIALALMLLLVPIVLAVPDIAAMSAGSSSADLSPGASAFVRWYSVGLTALLVWAEARLVLLSPVMVNERRGLGSVARAFALTAALTWRLIGVLLLFLVVAGLSVLAARSVTGVAAALLIEGDRPATVQFLAMAAGSLVAVGWATLAAIFAAQLYLARTDGVALSATLPPVAGATNAEPARPTPARAGPWG